MVGPGRTHVPLEGSRGHQDPAHLNALKQLLLSALELEGEGDPGKAWP